MLAQASLRRLGVCGLRLLGSRWHVSAAFPDALEQGFGAPELGLHLRERVGLRLSGVAQGVEERRSALGGFSGLSGLSWQLFSFVFLCSARRPGANWGSFVEFSTVVRPYRFNTAGVQCVYFSEEGQRLPLNMSATPSH